MQSSKVKTLAIISCGAKKKSIPAKARDLYEGNLYKAALSFVERIGFNFVIISAKHAILSPDQVVAPYEMRVDQMSKDQYRLWSLRVVDALKKLSPEKIIWLCPAIYCELPSKMLNGNIKHEFPLKGLGIGRQIQWLKQS